MSHQWSPPTRIRQRAAPSPTPRPAGHRQEHPLSQEDEGRERPALRGRIQLLVIAALAGALLAVALAGFLAFASRTGTASVAAQRICDALVARDYPSAYADLSDALQRQGTEEQFAASQQDLDRLNGTVTSCTFAYPHVAGSRATFTLDVTRTSKGTASGALRLVYERGRWRVDAYDTNVI
jgi:hypothetical protein